MVSRMAGKSPNGQVPQSRKPKGTAQANPNSTQRPVSPRFNTCSSCLLMPWHRPDGTAGDWLRTMPVRRSHPQSGSRRRAGNRLAAGITWSAGSRLCEYARWGGMHRTTGDALMPDLSFLPVLLVAAFVHGALGFGFPLVATPLLVLFMDLRAAVLLTLIPTISINLVSILGERHWKQALRKFWPIPAFTIVGSFLGTQVLLSVDPAPFRVLLALVVIGYLVTERLESSGQERRVPGWVMAAVGTGLGLMAGLVNIFAPAVVVYALYTRMHPAMMVATFNLGFLTSKTGQIAGFVSKGAFESSVLELMVWVVPAVLLSLWLGIRVRRRINQDSYRRLLRYALWVIAILLIADWLVGT